MEKEELRKECDKLFSTIAIDCKNFNIRLLRRIDGIRGRIEEAVKANIRRYPNAHYSSNSISYIVEDEKTDFGKYLDKIKESIEKVLLDYYIGLQKSLQSENSVSEKERLVYSCSNAFEYNIKNIMKIVKKYDFEMYAKIDKKIDMTCVNKNFYNEMRVFLRNDKNNFNNYYHELIYSYLTDLKVIAKSRLEETALSHISKQSNINDKNQDRIKNIIIKEEVVLQNIRQSNINTNEFITFIESKYLSFMEEVKAITGFDSSLANFQKLDHRILMGINNQISRVETLIKFLLETNLSFMFSYIKDVNANETVMNDIVLKRYNAINSETNKQNWCQELFTNCVNLFINDSNDLINESQKHNLNLISKKYETEFNNVITNFAEGILKEQINFIISKGLNKNDGEKINNQKKDNNGNYINVGEYVGNISKIIDKNILYSKYKPLAIRLCNIWSEQMAQFDKLSHEIITSIEGIHQIKNELTTDEVNLLLSRLEIFMSESRTKNFVSNWYYDFLATISNEVSLTREKKESLNILTEQSIKQYNLFINHQLEKKYQQILNIISTNFNIVNQDVNDTEFSSGNSQKK